MTELGVAVVIEDDADVRNLVEAILEQAGFEVHSAATGRDGVQLVHRHKASVVTLDVGLPDIDGYEVLRRIREVSDCYVVMLTARADELDTLTALQTGADDFLTKPFRPRELRARITAMMRRPRAKPARDQSTISTQAPPQQAGSVLQHNGLILNQRTRTVTRDGVELNLTRSEFELLQDLLSAAGGVRTKADLVRVTRREGDAADSYIGEADERAIETHMANLRRKLGENPNEPQSLLTVRGVGYRLGPRESP